MKKKIIIVMPCDLPVPAVQGGAVASLIESILKYNEIEQRLEISVFTCWTKEAEEASKKYSSTTFKWFKYKTMWKKLDLIIDNIKYMITRDKKKYNYIRKIAVIKEAKKIINENIYDAIIFENSGYLLNIIDKKIMQKYDNKIFYHLHNDIPSNINRKLLYKVNPILISKYLEKKIVKMCGSSEILDNCKILKNGINCELFENSFSLTERSEFRLGLGFSEKDKVIIYVGRINKAKGIDKLIDAVIRLNDPTIKLMIVGATNFGSGEVSIFERNLQEKCNKLGNRVKWIGFVHNSQLWKYYASSDLACLPSIWEEPAGLTMIEASAMGIPLITTISGGIPEYVDSNYAKFIQKDSNLVNNISNSIQEILHNLEEWQVKSRKGSNLIKENYTEKVYYNNFVNALVENKGEREKNHAKLVK